MGEIVDLAAGAGGDEVVVGGSIGGDRDEEDGEVGGVGGGRHGGEGECGYRGQPMGDKQQRVTGDA